MQHWGGTVKLYERYRFCSAAERQKWPECSFTLNKMDRAAQREEMVKAKRETFEVLCLMEDVSENADCKFSIILTSTHSHNKQKLHRFFWVATDWGAKLQCEWNVQCEGRHMRNRCRKQAKRIKLCSDCCHMIWFLYLIFKTKWLLVIRFVYLEFFLIWIEGLRKVLYAIQAIKLPGTNLWF